MLTLKTSLVQEVNFKFSPLTFQKIQREKSVYIIIQRVQELHVP